MSDVKRRLRDLETKARPTEDKPKLTFVLKRIVTDNPNDLPGGLSGQGEKTVGFDFTDDADEVLFIMPRPSEPVDGGKTQDAPAKVKAELETRLAALKKRRAELLAKGTK